jgi:hypothetical protein
MAGVVLAAGLGRLARRRRRRRLVGNGFVVVVELAGQQVREFSGHHFTDAGRSLSRKGEASPNLFPLHT